MIATLVLAGFLADTSSIHKPDTAPLYDSERTVSEISRTSFSLQYATTVACETKVEFREGGRFAAVAHATPAYRETGPGASLTLWHSIDITGLKPGKRYYYRIYDPGAKPTNVESVWGATPPWSREYAVSTQAPAGRKTIIHLPVKVLLMPNVVNAESAVQPDGSIAPDPPKITPAQLKLIKDEYKVASRFYWANSGMRLWVDFQFAVDDRWQRWGPTASGASGFFQNLPQCRSYGGGDFIQPGGGVSTFVDLKNPTKESSYPVDDGYACQIEQAWPRRWDPVLKLWKFYVSGGNTFGAGDFWQGVPARSQFLAGSDTAWLAADEFHHQLESLGSLCLGNSEDDRIVSDKPVPRHRNPRGDGTFNEQDWTTAGMHGELWDDLRYWDKQVSDCQWLRLGFGSTETVADKDGDGFPDKDARLPIDAARFKEAVRYPTYVAACNFDYVWVPVQPSWLKKWDDSRVVQRNGMSGTESRTHIESHKVGNQTEMLVGHVFDYPDDASPKLYQFHAPLNADPARWENVRDAGTLVNDMQVKFKQAYDDAGYYGLIVADGPVGHIDVTLDGGEQGLFNPPGGIAFTITDLKPSAGQAGPTSLPVSVKPLIGGARGQMPWLAWKAARKDGALVFEFKIPNGGDGPWYWQGAGHRIGFAVNVYDTSGRGYSMGEPYRLNYSRMMESRGREAISATPPAPLDVEEKVEKLGDGKAFQIRTGLGVEDGVLTRLKGTPMMLETTGLKFNDFDLTVMVDGQGAFTMGAYADQTARVDPDRDYSISQEGDNAVLHIFGTAKDGQRVHLGPGTHKLQLIRRTNGVWALIDGKVVASGRDPSPRVTLTKLGILLAPDTGMRVQEFRYRISNDPERSRQP